MGTHFSSFDLAPLSFVCVAFKKHESAKPDERGFKREREREGLASFLELPSRGRARRGEKENSFVRERSSEFFCDVEY